MMISGATRTNGNLSGWKPVPTSIFRNNTGGVSYSNPWSPDDEHPCMVDQHTVESCYKWLDRVVRLCQHPRLNLKNSPPYLLDIIPDVYEKLKSIIVQYSYEYDELSQLEYFRIFIHSLIDKCKRTVKLFKDAGEKIFDVNSHARFRLVKLSLIFSHLLKDLDALFPQNTFCTGFRITKPDAAKWWSSNFGQAVIVPWPVFQTALLRTFRVDSADQLIALRNTIDLTCNKYVSIFEFDVFIRLFQPWSNILETWKALAVLHPGYMAFMTYDEVKAVLKQYRSHPGPGSYVFRLSCTKLGQWAIGYVTDDLKILQTIIQNKSLAQALLDGEREGFYLYPNGQSSSSSLLYRLVHDLPQVHLQVTQEQYQVYCEMGSTFELCKICDENNKDVQLEPCGHLICKHCLFNCRSSGYSQTCPFCRLEIKGIEDVIVDPYRPNLSHTNSVYESLHGTNLCSQNSPSSKTHSPDLDDHSGENSLTKSVSHSSAPGSPRATTQRPPPVPPRNPATIASLSLPNNFKHNQVSIPRLTDRQFARRIQVISPSSPDVPFFTSLPPLSWASLNSSVAIKSSDYPSHSRSASCGCGSDHSTDHCMLNGRAASIFNTDSTPVSRPSEPCVARLNYAQLDLNPSDSEHEAAPELDCGSTSTVYASNLSLDPDIPLSKDNPLPDPLVCPDRTDGNRVVTDAHATIAKPTSSQECPVTIPSDSSSSPPTTSMPTSVARLCGRHADLDETTASLLLSITRNDLQMANQIWTHFMPRPDRLGS